MAKKDKKDKKEKKPKSKVDAHFVKLASMEDLARNATTFSGADKPIFAMKKGDSYRFFEQGASINEVRILLYFDSTKQGNFLAYKPANTNGPALLELKDTISPELQNREIHNLPVLEMTTNIFEEKPRLSGVVNVRIKDYPAVVKGTITRALEHESMGKIFAFKSGKQMYIGSFSLIEEEDIRLFCYAPVDSKENFAFFRYNYQTDKVEPTNSFGEHLYLYVRVINLAEPFSFFKPD